MKNRINSILTFHTDIQKDTYTTADEDKLTAWMLASYTKFSEISDSKMLITIKQSTFGIHRNSKNLHGHIAIVYDLQTYKKNPTNYKNNDAFRSAFRRHIDLPPSPFETSVKNKAVHLSMKINEPNTDHLSYVLKEYDNYDKIEFKEQVHGVTDLESRRNFAHTKYLDTIKANEYREKYENKSQCQLITLQESIDTSNLPPENLPVSLYVEILSRYNDIWCDLDETNQKYQILTKLQGIAYNTSQKLIKLPKNRRKLMLHYFKTNIPREERESNNVILPIYSKDLDPLEYVKKINKLTSK